MIATILFTSNLPNQNNQNNQNKQPQPENQDQNKKPQNQNESSKLTRSPSILHLLRSYNLYPQTSHQQQTQQEPLEVAATQFVFNHSFPHEQLPLEQDPKPISTNPKSSNLDPTRYDINHTNEVHLTNANLDPTRPDFKVNSKLQLTVDDNLDLTRPDFNLTSKVQLTSDNLNPTRPDFSHTNEVPAPPTKAQTHFVYDNNHTIEKVTAHFHFDPTLIENVNPPDPHLDPEEHDEFNSLDEIYSKITGGHVNRTKSDTLPASGELPVKLPTKMKKSASMKSAFSHFEEEKIVEARRPATVRERRSAAKATADDDVEVDAKADDFINKFKHQLKLQRLDSIIRYKEMVNKGTEK